MKPIDSRIVRERIAALRSKMKEQKIDAYLVVTDDFHASEYVCDYFKCREYISGFDGSAGTVVILQEEAGLWTDGRYFLQAEEELKGTGITLYRMMDEGVPELEDFLAEKLVGGATLGFDGRTVSSSLFRKLRKKLKDDVRIAMGLDLIGELWTGRPALPSQPVMELPLSYAGKSREEKLSEIRERMKEKDLDCTVIASLDDIAWLLNLRGGDVLYNPVFLSFLIVLPEEALLYGNRHSFDNEIISRLNNDGVRLLPYEDFYQALSDHTEGKRVLIDPARVTAAIIDQMPVSAEIVEESNLTLLPKAKKNPTEVENIKEAHRKDGVAVTRFLYWLKHHVGKEPLTEISVSKKLEEFRGEGEHYRGQSFAPIAGYGAHGAIIHYEATGDTDIPLAPENFLLLDTGGQYLEGTTDITRTIALGAVTEEQKKLYTAVLRGNLALGAAKFKYGCIGLNLDYLARSPLWEMGMDYNHGTGHGVGYYLNVHEGPQAFRFKLLGNAKEQTLEEGMVISNEPGIYLPGQFGIRIENLMVVKKLEKNEYGQFMGFDTLTLVPYEPDAIDVSMLTEREKELLNRYHQTVYDEIAPFLAPEEREWLSDVTKPL
ncbi:MAG: aminopeptidase P family protein [Lachnospiraceae bacterium]|nr:aminopeptidase P family protein [Lachnospiraceae bacterium]